MRAARLLTLALALAGCGARSTPAQEPPREPLSDGEMDSAITVQLAETLISSGAAANAVPLLRRALAREPDDARLHYLLGLVLRDRGVYAEAERELNLAIRLADTQKVETAPIYSGLGILYDISGRPLDARVAHEKATQRAPDVAQFQNNLGFSYYLAGDYDAAIKCYEHALSKSPNADRVYINLGFALAAKGDEAGAMRMFKQTLTHAEALNNLALAHELQKSEAGRERARALYRDALAADPGLDAATTNLEALEAETVAPPARGEEGT